MTGNTHRLIGGSTAFVATSAVGLSLPVVVAVSAVALMSSTAPDRAEKVLGLPHRRITHYPAAQLAFIALITYFSALYLRPEPWPALVIGAGLAIGCLTHSLADAMTVEKNGIRLLWPISRRGYHLLPWSLRVWSDEKATSQRVFAALWCSLVLIYAYVRFGHLISS